MLDIYDRNSTLNSYAISNYKYVLCSVRVGSYLISETYIMTNLQQKNVEYLMTKFEPEKKREQAEPR